MGIYIEGLDWPELGMPITITLFNDGAVNEEGIADYQAIEVKTPHGRLIDADELWEHIGRDRLDSRELIMKMIDNAPTVIKSEVE